MSPIPVSTATLVEARAQGRCEYCRMHQSLQGATFHVEHILPSSRGGSDDLGNLAWCCPSCNLYKSDRIEAVDPESNVLVPFYNPRLDVWSEHFRWNRYEVVPLTSIARAVVAALRLNSPRRILIRQAEERFALFPPS